MASFCREIGISVGKFRTWLEKHEQFKDVWDVCKTVNLSDWEQTGVDLATGESKGNATAFKFMAINQQPDEFRDKQEISHSGNAFITIDTGIKRPGDEGFDDWIEGAPEMIEDSEIDMI